MPKSTEEIEIEKLLINGRQGRSFRSFDREFKEYLEAEYLHMAKYFYTGTRKLVAQRQVKRRSPWHLMWQYIARGSEEFPAAVSRPTGRPSGTP